MSGGWFRGLFDDMAKNWKPPQNRSQFESIGFGGKTLKPQETNQNHVMGCGDPNCPICMPEGGGGGGAKFGGGDDTARENLIREQLANARAEMLRVAMLYDGFMDGAASQRQDERSKAAAREKELRSKVERFFLKTKHSTAWEDVIGNEAAHVALIEAIEHPVVHRDLYAHYRKKPTKGVLLYGAPGCGKTMLGKAAASVLAKLHGKSAAGQHIMLHIKGPEIQSPYVGVTEAIIRDIFAYASAYKALHGYPLVVFIDEADAILPSRDGAGGRRALPWEESNVATFLSEMDGLEDSGALVILATNRPDVIDAAILRDGRCDRKIRVERPTFDHAATIISKCLVEVPLVDVLPIDVGELGAATAEYLFDWQQHRIARLVTEQGVDFLTLGHIVSGAMLVGLVEIAKGIAFRRDLAAGGKPTGVCLADLTSAVDAVFEQNRGLMHEYAIREYCKKLGVERIEVQPIRQELIRK